MALLGKDKSGREDWDPESLMEGFLPFYPLSSGKRKPRS